MTLTRKLLASYLTLVIVAGGTLIYSADRALRSRLTAEAAVELEREAGYLAAATRGSRGTALDSLVHALAARTGRRLTVIDRAGVVIADSDFRSQDLHQLENHAGRPEVREALAGRTGTDLRRSASTGRWELKVAVPWDDGVVRVSSPLTQVDAVVGEAQGAVLLGALLAAGISGLLALGFAVNVARPLVRMRDAAQLIARGESPSLDLRGRDEVGDLARALRTMDETLSSRLGDLERERSEMAALIASMVEGVVACNSSGAVTALNPAARRLLGLGPEDRPASLHDLLRHRAARSAVESTLSGGTTAGVEVEQAGRTILLSGQPLPGGGAVFVLHDVTEVKRLEAVRRDFVANVSHELKTPLTVLRGYAETLLKDEPPADLSRGFLKTMLDNSRRMQRLVDDLLDLSRLESGTWKPESEPVALELLAREVWDTVSAGAPGKPAFATTIEPGASHVRADPQALRQILANLLENAARHTPPDGSVEVRAMNDDAGIVLEVADTGAGIAGEHLTRVFERFYRVDPARSREQGGTGLGLAIVKHLVEAHGGRVEARSTLGAGTTIRVHLPAA